MLPEQKLTVKIHKFLITPIATAYNEAGEVVGEKALQQVQHFTVTPLDLQAAARNIIAEFEMSDAKTRTQVEASQVKVQAQEIKEPEIVKKVADVVKMSKAKGK